MKTDVAVKMMPFVHCMGDLVTNPVMCFTVRAPGRYVPLIRFLILARDISFACLYCILPTSPFFTFSLLQFFIISSDTYLFV